MNPLQSVTDLMAIAARTAPKAAGQDYVVVKLIEGELERRFSGE